MRNQKVNMKKYLMGLGALVFGGAFWACSDFDKTSGTDEQSEGIVALADKKFSGKAQKGPLVKGSDVVLRETSAEGKLEPTGREFETKTINDKGEFKFGDLNLESQYVLLSAEGYYTRENDSTRSECPMRLDAVTNLNNRNTANINLLTHFEYKRVLKLVEEGKTFAEAKKQASMEVLGAFGVEIDATSAEDLDIFNTSEGDRTLYNISKLVDNRGVWDHWDGEGSEYDRWAYYYANENIDCSRLQAFIDGFADDYADDGVLSDTIMQWLVSNAYDVAQEYSHLEYIDEDDMREKDAVDPGSYEILSDMKKEYEFAKFLFLNYMGLERCSEDLWGAYREFHRPIQVVDTNDYMLVVKDSGYFLCDGYSWELTTMERIEAMSTMIDHENGSMTDPRDGQEYKTVSFEHKGKTYEWMAEDLKYSATPVVHSRRATGNHLAGIYTWTEAMRLNESYMTKLVPNDMVDSLHQGVCPEGWHLANREEWDALLDYVGGVNNLLDESWRTSRYYAFGKGLAGVFYNRFDFNLVPMDKDLLELFYHTYGKDSYGMTPEPEEDMKEWIESVEDDDYREALEDWFMPKITGTYALELSIGRSIYKDEAQREGRVRCVKN